MVPDDPIYMPSVADTEMVFKPSASVMDSLKEPSVTAIVWDIPLNIKVAEVMFVSSTVPVTV